MKKCFIILPLLLLAACAPINNNVFNVQVKTNEYSTLIEIDGPRNYVNPLGGISYEWWLQSFVNKDTHKVTHRLYADFEYLDRKHRFYAAVDNDAHILHVSKLPNSGNKECLQGDVTVKCEIIETLLIDIKESYLKAHQDKDKPYSIAVTSRSGDEIILPISPLLVSIQLGIVQNELKKEAATSP